MGQWGHATREFHHALLKMRHERGSQAPLKKVNPRLDRTVLRCGGQIKSRYVRFEWCPSGHSHSRQQEGANILIAVMTFLKDKSQ